MRAKSTLAYILENSQSICIEKRLDRVLPRTSHQLPQNNAIESENYNRGVQYTDDVRHLNPIYLPTLRRQIVKMFVVKKMVYLRTSKDHIAIVFGHPVDQLAMLDIRLKLLYNLALNHINDISKMTSHNMPPRCLCHRVHTLVFVCQLAIDPVDKYMSE